MNERCECGHEAWRHHYDNNGCLAQDCSGEYCKCDRSDKQVRDGNTSGADPINSPAHYKVGSIEAIDVIEAFQLNYRTGNVAKYLLRHQYKGEPLKDLKKAKWYLEREIARLEKEQSK